MSINQKAFMKTTNISLRLVRGKTLFRLAQTHVNRTLVHRNAAWMNNKRRCVFFVAHIDFRFVWINDAIDDSRKQWTFRAIAGNQTAIYYARNKIGIGNGFRFTLLQSLWNMDSYCFPPCLFKLLVRPGAAISVDPSTKSIFNRQTCENTP